jgi:hypothetical protein
MKKKPLPPGYYDPADYVLVHKQYLAELRARPDPKTAPTPEPDA